ncbi:MAG: DUF433 domain-containing protein [Fimbriimonadaceae bacterium]|nr:DUF433 domain-containing protein [Fimbriimonadaceae bacterium]
MNRRILCDGAVSCDPDVVSGTPVFAGTRVPVKTLFDYLAAGCSVDAFLEAFDGVGRDQVEKVLSNPQTA